MLPDAAALASCTLLPAGVTVAVLALATRGRPTLLLDHPGERSLHTVPKPRVGGLAIATGLATTSLALGERPSWWAAWMMLVGVSLIDDFRTLRVSVRLLAHLVAAAWLLYDSGSTHPAGVAAAVALSTVWMINLFNFMDGADGLAGGMAVFGFGALAAGAGLSVGLDGSWLALAVVSAAIGFLLFNFPPARAFMGDAGSVPLGFLAAALAMQGWSAGWWSAWFGVLAFLPFVADATVTLLRRALRGEQVWLPHREHFYQRLVRSGWSHRRTALAYYALMLGCAGTAVAALELFPGALHLATLAWCAALGAFFLWVERRFRRAGAQAPHG